MSQPPYPSDPQQPGGSPPPDQQPSYPQPGQQPTYAPAPGQGQGYPPPGQGYPPPGQGYPPPPGQGQGYPPPPGQGYPPPAGAQAYPPADQGFGSAPGQAYPPADQGFGGAPGFPPPKKKSKVLPIILIVLAVVVLLCAGTVTAGYFLVKDEVGAGVAASRTRLVTPATLGGRPKIDDPQFSGLTSQLTGELKRSVPAATSTVGAIYGSPLKQDIVLVAGASAPVTDPEKELDRFFTSMGSAQMTITDVASTDPGPLGGVAKCGNADTSGIKLAVCGWADQGSVAMIGTFFKTADEVRAGFPALRAEIEKKS